MLAWYSHDLAIEMTEERGAARDGSPRLPLSEMIFSLRALAEVLAIVAEAKPVTARALHNWGTADGDGGNRYSRERRAYLADAPGSCITPACVIQAGVMFTRYCHGPVGILELLSDYRKN